MPSFLSHDLAELTRQLVYVPPHRRRQQMDRIEQLYWEIDPERNYPLDFITYRITRFRPGNTDTTTLVGKAVRKDLLRMVERLSESLEDAADDYDPRPYDLAGLRRRLGVTDKTISRYRRDGLFARRVIFPNGRTRLAFLPGSVDRFLESRKSGGAKKAAAFSRIDEPTRHRILTRARRIASRTDASPYTVARHLARKLGRSTEAVRLLLIRHDREDPRVAIFPDHTPPLTEKQQRVIHRAYHRGVPIARLAKRFSKARAAIYHAINRRRAMALGELEIRYVRSPMFERPDAEAVILGSEPPAGTEDHERTRTGRRPTSAGEFPSAAAGGAEALSIYLEHLYDEPLPNTAAERAWFVRYNYLKFRAAQLREGLDRHHPRAGQLDRIETYLRRAVASKHRLVRVYLRVVVAVARRHLGSRGGGFEPRAMAELIDQGNRVLLEMIETFDPGRGNRFSTYLSWALMRRFARAARTGEPAASPGSDGQRGEYWPAALNPNLAAMEHAEHAAQTLTRLLGELDEHERRIITRRFGLGDGPGRAAEPRTLAEVAAELEITPERARQIEHRTIRKLRRAAARLGLTLPTSDTLPAPYRHPTAENAEDPDMKK